LTLVPESDDGGDDEALECDRWDATFQRITVDETPELHFWRTKGVYVLGVSYPGNAASSGLASEDIVLRVDGEAVETLEQLKGIYERVMKEDRPKKRVLFEVLRRGYLEYVSLDYGPDYDAEK
jgi:S1-C subfamily serine protease